MATPSRPALVDATHLALRTLGWIWWTLKWVSWVIYWLAEKGYRLCVDYVWPWLVYSVWPWLMYVWSSWRDRGTDPQPVKELVEEPTEPVDLLRLLEPAPAPKRELFRLDKHLDDMHPGMKTLGEPSDERKRP